jgi:hypothetical protein
VIVKLTQNKEALFSPIDFPLIASHKWCYDKGRALTNINGHNYLMHRLIMKPDTGMEVDHINGNALDNRRSNLRICTRAQNAMNFPKTKFNTSGLVGVHFTKSEKRRKRWVATIRWGHKKHTLGRFFTKEEAFEVWKQAAIKHRGCFVRQDEILGKPVVNSDIIKPVAE